MNEPTSVKDRLEDDIDPTVGGSIEYVLSQNIESGKNRLAAIVFQHYRNHGIFCNRLSLLMR